MSWARAPPGTNSMLVLSSLPFALAAALFPAGLVTTAWLLSTPPALRRGATYLAGAAVTTAASGAVIVALMDSVGGTTDHPALTAAFEMGAGVALFGIGWWLAARRPPLPDPARPRPRRHQILGIFGLGMLMWTPSFAYVAALQQIADARLGPAGLLLNLLVVDAVVLSSVEIPLVIYAISPRRASQALDAVWGWLRRLGWQVAAAAVFVGGAYLVVRGALRVS